MATKAELERQERERKWPKVPAPYYGAPKEAGQRWDPLVRQTRKRAKEKEVKAPASGS